MKNIDENMYNDVAEVDLTLRSTGETEKTQFTYKRTEYSVWSDGDGKEEHTNLTHYIVSYDNNVFAKINCCASYADSILGRFHIDIYNDRACCLLNRYNGEERETFLHCLDSNTDIINLSNACSDSLDFCEHVYINGKVLYGLGDGCVVDIDGNIILHPEQLGKVTGLTTERASGKIHTPWCIVSGNPFYKKYKSQIEKLFCNEIL